MPTLRTIHDPCGEIEMDTIDVVLFVAPDGTGTYRFECPNCYLMVKKLADQRIVSLLRAAEVRLVEGVLQARRAVRAGRGSPPTTSSTSMCSFRPTDGSRPRSGRWAHKGEQWHEQP